ncbi:MAG: helix-turn-helix domain-containing protein [archaeon]
MQTVKSFKQTGYTNVSNSVLVDNNLSPQAKVLYMQLKMHCFQKDHCFPGQETLAEYNNVSVRTIENWLNELKSKGFITIVNRGNNKTNKYILNAKSVSPKDTKYSSHKERKDLKLINNNKKSLNKKSLSEDTIKLFKQTFKSINQTQIDKMNDYIVNHNFEEKLIYKVIKVIGLGGHNATFFFGKLERLLSKGITTVKAYNNNKVKDIRKYKQSKKCNVKELKNMVNKCFNENISISEINKLLKYTTLSEFKSMLNQSGSFEELKYNKILGYK